jgi:hypothetical protein
MNNYWQAMEGDAAHPVEAGMVRAAGWNNGHNEHYWRGGPYVPYFSLSFHEYCETMEHDNGTEQISTKGIILLKRYGSGFTGEFPDIGDAPSTNTWELWQRLAVAHCQDDNIYVRYILGAEFVEHVGGTGDPCVGVFRKNVYAGNHPNIPNPPWYNYTITCFAESTPNNVVGYTNASLYGHSISALLHSGFIEIDQNLDHCDGRGFVVFDNKRISIESGDIFTTGAVGPVNPMEIHYQTPTDTNLSIYRPCVDTTEWAPLLMGNKGTTLRRIPQIKITPVAASDNVSITVPEYNDQAIQLAMQGSGRVDIEIQDNASQFYRVYSNNLIPVNALTPASVTKTGRFRVTSGTKYQISRGTQPVTVVTSTSTVITFSNIGLTGISTVYKIEPVKVYAVTVTADNSSLPGDGTSTTVLRAVLRDVSGTKVNDATNAVTFLVTGPGTLVGTNPCPAVAGEATITLKSSISPGTVSITATANNISLPTEHVYALRLKATSTGASSFIYRDFATRPGFQAASGDFLEYDVFIPNTSTNKRGSVDIEFVGAALRDTAGAVDQNGVAAHPNADLSAYAANKWYHRVITIPASLAGKNVESVELASDGFTGTAEFYVRNIRITNGGVPRAVFHNNTKIANFNLEKFGSYLQTCTDDNHDCIELAPAVSYNPVSSVNIEILSAGAEKIVCSANPTTVTADGGLSVSTVTASLVDDNNQLVTIATNTVSFILTGPQNTGTFDGVNPCPAVAGQATIRVKSGTVVGSCVINAVSAGLTLVNGSTVTYVHGPANALVTFVNQQYIEANGTSSATITTRIFDKYGNSVNSGPDSTKLIIYKIIGTESATWADGTVTDKQVGATAGVATISLKSTSQPGPVIVTSSSTFVVGDSTGIITVAGNPSKLIVNSAQLTVVADGVAVTTITARVTDTNDNTVVTYNQGIGFRVEGLGIFINGTTVQTIIPVSGIATVVYRSTYTVGVSTIIATSGSLTQGSVSITRVPGSPVLIRVGATLVAQLVADGLSVSSLTARIYDLNNNQVISANNFVTFNLAGPGIIEGSPINAVNGTATARFRSGTVAQISTITVTAVGLVSGTTSLIVVSGTAVKQIMTSNPSVIYVGGQISTVTIKVTDIYNNIKTNYPGNLTVTISGDGTWLDNSVGASMLALVSGIGIVGVKSNSNAGNIVVIS